jgi:hypothetical protein
MQALAIVILREIWYRDKYLTKKSTALQRCMCMHLWSDCYLVKSAHSESRHV